MSPPDLFDHGHKTVVPLFIPYHPGGSPNGKHTNARVFSHSLLLRAYFSLIRSSHTQSWILYQRQASRLRWKTQRPVCVTFSIVWRLHRSSRASGRRLAGAWAKRAIYSVFVLVPAVPRASGHTAAATQPSAFARRATWCIWLQRRYPRHRHWHRPSWQIRPRLLLTLHLPYACPPTIPR